IESGMLWFAQTEDGWEHASAQVLKNLDIPCEVLDPADGARFFPDFSPEGLSHLLWEPHAGVIRARRATQVTARLAEAAGVRRVRARATPAEGGAVRAGDEVLTADRVVWACGAWLPELFEVPMTVTKQDTLHFAVPAEWTTPA